MKMDAGISAMPGEQMRKIHATMGKWMPMTMEMMKSQWMVSSAAGADRLVEPLCGHDNSADQSPVIDFQAAIRAPEPRRSRDSRKKLASPPRSDGILPARRLRRA